MATLGFEITLNGKLLCRAGIDNEAHVLSCILDAIAREGETPEHPTLSVSGLDSVEKRYVQWFMGHSLSKGDRIGIEVVEGGFDAPTKIRPEDPKELVIEQKIQYFHRLKEELKEYLEE